MYLIYIDESGDTGLTRSPTRYFVLSALAVHETDWSRLLDEVIAMRRSFSKQLRIEIAGRNTYHALVLQTWSTGENTETYSTPHVQTGD